MNDVVVIGGWAVSFLAFVGIAVWLYGEPSQKSKK
jgi:hypothetical protein